MKLTLVDYTDNPEDKIASYAAICYNSKTDEDSNRRRVKHLMDVKHLATLRFAYATFKIEGISRACSHQLVRHPHLSFLQQSQRYVNQSEQGFVYPTDTTDINHIHISSIYAGLSLAYEHLIKDGMKKEDARYILPAGVQTTLYATGNFQAWFDFLSNRLDKHAQWEIRQLSGYIRDDLIRIAPNVFSKFRRIRDEQS